MKLKFFLLLILVGLIPILAPFPRVAAACQDQIISNEARQYYAPLTVQLEFKQTANRNGDWTSQGLITGKPRTGELKQGSDYLTFNAFGNDTYTFWFSVTYDVVVNQNVTLTIIEGSRVPAKERLCMNGRNIFIKWTNISVVAEPHQLTKPELLDVFMPQLVQAMKSVVQSNSDFQGAVNANSFIQMIEILVLVGLVVDHYKLRKRLGG